MKLFPHQELAATFLCQDNHRLLGDEQRVGKTAAALEAVKRLNLEKVLVVTPVSVQHVWKREAGLWQLPLSTGICDISKQFCIVPWSRIASGELGARLRGVDWDLIIADESHYAKSTDSQRTKAFYGKFVGRGLDQSAALTRRADRVWCLTGTPIPHDPSDLFPMMRALFPDVMTRSWSWPDVTAYSDFEARYVITRPKRVSAWRSIKVKVGGKREAELGARLGNRMLRRRQKDIGIRPAIHDLLPLPVSSRERDMILSLLGDEDEVLDAATHGDFRRLSDLVTARVLHVTGDIKAIAVATAAKDYFEDSADKLVIAYWHRSVGDYLHRELAKYRPVRIDGETPANWRGRLIDEFKMADRRVFLAQIAAAGEGIDLSVAPELWFCESVFSPRMMSQMAARITNVNDTVQKLVRVCMLAGSIDENIQEALQRLYTTIAKVLEDR